MNRIVLTGAAGFAGSHVLERFVAEFPDAEFIVLDKMTYAAHYDNIADVLHAHQAYLAVGDVCDLEFCLHWLEGADLVVHLAAESHVDRSFGNSRQFTVSNTLGTHTLLEACRVQDVGRIIHVSTDEVYGQAIDGAFDEDSILNPSNPYSASKAGADMIVNSYIKSFDLPVQIVRANNLYGTRQFPEKIIPRFILNSLRGARLPLHGDGLHLRNFLSVKDFADALVTTLLKGQPQEIYNVCGTGEFSSIEIAEMICQAFGKTTQEVIEYVTDRPFNDKRYAVSAEKIQRLGWYPQRRLTDELTPMIDWYRANIDRYARVQ